MVGLRPASNFFLGYIGPRRTAPYHTLRRRISRFRSRCSRGDCRPVLQPRVAMHEGLQDRRSLFGFPGLGVGVPGGAMLSATRLKDGLSRRTGCLANRGRTPCGRHRQSAHLPHRFVVTVRVPGGRNTGGRYWSDAVPREAGTFRSFTPPFRRAHPPGPERIRFVRSIQNRSDRLRWKLHPRSDPMVRSRWRMEEARQNGVMLNQDADGGGSVRDG